ncbi:hypothetical protein ACFV42_48060 [Streptomyces solisilvae]|uniref:hypothetical protein n=1 Tax=Streptomyces malaysiensis TaxID=92644 RepID=UPI0036C2D827
MGRRILVFCDAHSTKDVEAQVADIAIRIADPNDPSGARLIAGSLEICTDHQEPIERIASMIENQGANLNEEAQQLLVNTIRRTAKTDEDSDYVLCMDCTPPKRLKRTSLYGHSDKMHDKKPSETTYTPYFPEKQGDLPSTQ